VNGHTTDSGGSALVREIAYVVFKRKTFLISLVILAAVLIVYGFVLIFQIQRQKKKHAARSREQR